ncbi:hypothetical protein GCM10009850_079810 [Nonomuraea monospora]|uniref:Uncharacterized protein n=1 Tax=Nonomuraea monospora TaxID=568818 RepID=A0ABN3CT29_9ACTN
MHPDALTRRARRHGWTVDTATGPVLTLRRRSWLLEIAFADNAPHSARITSPDNDGSHPVNLRSINALLRAAPDDRAPRRRSWGSGQAAPQTRARNARLLRLQEKPSIPVAARRQSGAPLPPSPHHPTCQRRQEVSGMASACGAEFGCGNGGSAILPCRGASLAP